MNQDPNKPLVHSDADGNVTINVKSGQYFALPAGNAPVTVNTPNIESVGIKNLVDVESYSIQTILNSRSHVVRFTNGGLLKFAYNKEGQLIELSSSQLQCDMSKNAEVMFSLPP